MPFAQTSALSIQWFFEAGKEEMAESSGLGDARRHDVRVFPKDVNGMWVITATNEQLMQQFNERLRRLAVSGWIETPLTTMAVAAFIVGLWLTVGRPGMVWDEPPDIERIDRIEHWFSQLFGGVESRSWALSEGLTSDWPFCGAAPHEHPPVYALIGLCTRTVSQIFVPYLDAHRLATVVVFALTAAVLFRFVRKQWGTWAGWTTMAALLFNPRIFAHGQLVTLDAVVAGFSVFALVRFVVCCETGRHCWLFGLLFGLAVMSKATGVLVFPALVVWTLVCRPPNAWRQLAWAMVVAPLASYVLMPGWWLRPVDGPLDWIHGLTDYKQIVSVHYLGTTYDIKTTRPPWHEPWVIGAVTVPLGILLTGWCGVIVAGVRSFKLRGGDAVKRDNVARVFPFLLTFLFWKVLRMVGLLPAHDGLRQLLTAYVCFAVLCGFFASAAAEACFAAHRSRSFRLVGATGLAVVAIGMTDAATATLRIHPFELSYYNRLIGGPRGALIAGFDSTYYWDAAGEEVLSWMNANLPADSVVLLLPPPDVRVFDLQKQRELLRQDFEFVNVAPGLLRRIQRFVLENRPVFVLLMMRQSFFLTEDIQALANRAPIWEFKPERVGVRLLALYRFEQLADVMIARTAREKGEGWPFDQDQQKDD